LTAYGLPLPIDKKCFDFKLLGISPILEGSSLETSQSYFIFSHIDQTREFPVPDQALSPGKGLQQKMDDAKSFCLLPMAFRKNHALAYFLVL
jgi:hypothetical protein